jgi:hypothetical protein
MSQREQTLDFMHFHGDHHDEAEDVLQVKVRGDGLADLGRASQFWSAGPGIVG